MKILNIVFIGLCLSNTACSKNETAPIPVNNTSAETGATTQKYESFLSDKETPAVEIHDESNGVVSLRLRNHKDVSIANTLEINSGELPIAGEVFYSTVCGKLVLVLVLKQGVNTAVSTGTYYYDALIDPTNGKLLTSFEAGEVTDVETKEIISDEQKSLIKKLRAGVDIGGDCSAIRQMNP